MNQTIQTMLNHRSIRDYQTDPIEKDKLDLILQSAQMAPSSINGQQMSIILVTDKKRKYELSVLCGNQVYIDQAPVFLIFCADFYRTKLACEKQGTELKLTNSLESTLVGAIDVGLAMQNAITAAESLGLGTVPIGGIRNEPLEVAKLLNLPDYVFPLCGLVIGTPKDQSALKPRLPREAVVFNEAYDHTIAPHIDQYDETMKNYMLERTNGKSDRNWSTTVSSYYSRDTQRDVRKAMAEKGFKNN